MNKRLATDAKIVLERAGYTVVNFGYGLDIDRTTETLHIVNGTVNNTRVVELLKIKGFNEFGYKL